MGLTNDAEAELSAQLDLEKMKLGLLIILRDCNGLKPSAGDTYLQAYDEDQIVRSWAAFLCEQYKLAVWLGSYMCLAAAYWVSAQAWIGPASQILLPWSAKGIQVITEAAKVLATAGCSGLCISAALHLNPLTADPLPPMVQRSYQLFDKKVPYVRKLRIANFIVVLAVTAGLMKRL